jgi:DNA modification methylase
MPVLSFKGKTAVENHHHTVPHHVLEVDRKLSELPKGEKPSLDGNLIIEGDNLLALKALLPTHAGKVKCIYIDPPYNTGNEGWIYNDNLTQPQFKEWIGREVGKEAEDACRHDKWCCLIYPRLRLLRDLLREDGSIWVSIDDNEVSHLRSLMDEIFGENNLIACVVWRNSTGPKQSRHLSQSHDYVLAYAKSAETWTRNLLPRTPDQEADYENPDNDPRGPWRSGGLDARNFYSRGRYPIKCPSGRIIPGPPGESYWRFPEETFWELDEDNRIWWGDDGDNVPRIKRFLSEVQQGLIPQTVWDYDEVGHTQEAKQEVLRILGSTDAPITPKPVALLRRIVHIASNPGDLVLDSFAGTGTTGHAVLEMNREARDPRQFVLVQSNHDTKGDIAGKRNLCETLTAERVRRVIRGYSYTKRGPKGKTTKAKESGLGGSFTYARVGAPLLGDNRSWGERMPSYEELARYVFFTETGKELDPKKGNGKTGKIGEHGGASYYLLYTPDPKSSVPLDQKVLDTLAKDPNPRKVVYCEKVWVHREDLARLRKEMKGLGEVRTMLLPLQVKVS